LLLQRGSRQTTDAASIAEAIPSIVGFADLFLFPGEKKFKGNESLFAGTTQAWGSLIVNNVSGIIDWTALRAWTSFDLLFKLSVAAVANPCFTIVICE